MRLGICIKGAWKDELFDVELPGRGAWTHCSVQFVSGFTEDYFDFDEDHIVNFLLEHPYECGTYLPESIITKLLDKVDPSDEYFVDTLKWLMRYLRYDKKFI